MLASGGSGKTFLSARPLPSNRGLQFVAMIVLDTPLKRFGAKWPDTRVRCVARSTIARVGPGAIFRGGKGVKDKVPRCVGFGRF